MEPKLRTSDGQQQLQRDEGRSAAKQNAARRGGFVAEHPKEGEHDEPQARACSGHPAQLAAGEAQLAQVNDAEIPGTDGTIVEKQDHGEGPKGVAAFHNEASEQVK